MNSQKPSDWGPADITSVVQELKSNAAPPAFRGLTRAAAALCNAPVALISIIDEATDRQVFASQLGLPSPWRERGATPLSHSFCQHVKAGDAPLVVRDSREHPLVSDNLAIRDLNVVSYLGLPVHDPEGNALGAICVIDDTPREWTARDEALLKDLAVCVSDEILLRAYVLHQEKLCQGLHMAHERLKRYAALSEMVAQPALAPGLDLPGRLRELLRNTAGAFGYHTGHLALVEPGAPGRARIVARVCPAGIRATDTTVSLKNTLAERVIETGHTLTRHACQPEEARRDLTGAPVRDYAAVPVLGSAGTAIGLIELTGPTLRATPMDKNDETVLGIASMFAATLIEIGKSDTPSGEEPLLKSRREKVPGVS